MKSYLLKVLKRIIIFGGLFIAWCWLVNKGIDLYLM